jgi:hypothetical protein
MLKPMPHSPDPRDVPEAYLPLIAKMRFYVEPDVSCSRFFAKACFTERSLTMYRNTGDPRELERTEMGEFLAKHLAGAAFYDIPCGQYAMRDQEEDFDVAPLAFTLGVQECIEVDATADVIRDRITRPIEVIRDGAYVLAAEDGPMNERMTDGGPVTTIQDDLLGFLAKLSEQKKYSKNAFYLSGIQPDATLCKSEAFQQDVAVPYLRALYGELARLCGAGDTVILNSGTMLVTGLDENRFSLLHPALALPPLGFDLQRRCAYDKVHVFAKISEKT